MLRRGVAARGRRSDALCHQRRDDPGDPRARLRETRYVRIDRRRTPGALAAESV